MSASAKDLRAIDTNILVRFIMADDGPQLSSVDRLLENETNRFFVTHIVLVELIWVLKRIHGLTKPSLEMAVSRILASPTFKLERELLVSEALAQYRSGRADFADYLTGAISQDAGCRDTVTFDRKLREAPGFTVLE